MQSEGRRLSSVVECLPSMQPERSLGLIPSTEEKKITG